MVPEVSNLTGTPAAAERLSGSGTAPARRSGGAALS